MGEALTGRRTPHRLLLEAERLRERRRSDSHRLIGPALALANLFFLAYAERFLRDDRGILSPLLAADLTLLLWVSASYLLSSTSAALDRTRLFPLRPMDRFRYSFSAMLRSMPVLLWSAGTLLAFILLYHGSFAEASGVAVLLLLLFATAESWLVASHLILRRRGIADAWVLAVPPVAILPAHAVASGIGGIAAGMWGDAAAATLALFFLFLLSLAAARRGG